MINPRIEFKPHPPMFVCESCNHSASLLVVDGVVQLVDCPSCHRTAGFKELYLIWNELVARLTRAMICETERLGRRKTYSVSQCAHGFRVEFA